MPVRSDCFDPIIAHLDGEIATKTLGWEKDREVWRFKGGIVNWLIYKDEYNNE